MGAAQHDPDTMTIEPWQERLEQWRPIFLGCWIGVFLCVALSMALPHKMNWNPYFHGVLGYDHEALVDANIPLWVWDSGTASERARIQQGRDRLRLLTLGIFVVLAISVVPIGTGRHGKMLRIIQAGFPAALLSVALLALVLQRLGLWQIWVESPALAGMGRLTRLALMFGGLWLVWTVVMAWWWSDRRAFQMLWVMWMAAASATMILILLRRDSGTGEQAAWVLGLLAWVYVSGMLALWPTAGEQRRHAVARLHGYRWRMQRQRIARMIWPPWQASVVLMLAIVCTFASFAFTFSERRRPPRTLRPTVYEWLFSSLDLGGPGVTPSYLATAIFFLIALGPVLLGFLGLWTYLFVGGMRSVR